MRRLLDVLLPHRCLQCRDLLPKPSGTLCANCDSQLKSAEHTIHPALFLYAGMLREIVVRAKFKPDEAISRALARLLKEKIDAGKLPIQTEDFEFVTYVPSHYRRLLSRGHELPRLLARAISKSTGKPLRCLLVCTRFDPPLSALPGEVDRSQIVEGRYRAVENLEPCSVLLVDDVTTTGATLHAAARALANHGHVPHTLAFAATPLSKRTTTPLNK